MYYDMSLPTTEAKHHKDVRVDEDQWNEFWTYWGSDEAKRKDNVRTPTRVEMFNKVYSRADGRPSNSIVAEKLNEMKEKLRDLPPDHEDAVSRDDVFSQFMGQDNSGYVRLYGDGVHPNDTWSKNPSRRKLFRDNVQQETKLKMLEQKLKEQAATIAQMQAQMQVRSSDNEQLESRKNVSTGSNGITSARNAKSSNGFRVGREVLLKSIFDAAKTVARGYIRSMDPLTIVHGCLLGPKWFEVEVKVVTDGDECLIRPYYPLETIQDALGATVAWPKHLISIYTDQ